MRMCACIFYSTIFICFVRFSYYYYTELNFDAHVRLFILFYYLSLFCVGGHVNKCI